MPHEVDVSQAVMRSKRCNLINVPFKCITHAHSGASRPRVPAGPAGRGNMIRYIANVYSLSTTYMRDLSRGRPRSWSFSASPFVQIDLSRKSHALINYMIHVPN